MSILYGVSDWSGRPGTQEDLDRLEFGTRPRAARSSLRHILGGTAMAVQPVLSHARTSLEAGPAARNHEALVAWDGRLDNHVDLERALGLETATFPDPEIVLEGFFRWGTAVFSRLIGDWSLGLWSSPEQTLYLARDHAGSRTLYYHKRRQRCIWSTSLDSLLTAEPGPDLDREYLTRYIAGLRIGPRTPYSGIFSVPPGHFAAIRSRGIRVVPHWNWFREPKGADQGDNAYEAEFLHYFEQSVSRRTGAGVPVLAHLSGGMDSSSIVCVADRLHRSLPHHQFVETVSFTDATDADWNEQPYFSVVESSRNHTGLHFQTTIDWDFEPPATGDRRPPFPGKDLASQVSERAFDQRLARGGFTVMLSGIGGDELVGGVPTALPELADLWAERRFATLLDRTIAWCLIDRTPIYPTLYRSARFAGRMRRPEPVDHRKLPPWLIRTPEAETLGWNSGMVPPGAPPSIYARSQAWWHILESMPHLSPGLESTYEYRYPYLDRDLVEFLMRIPRNQLARPGERRSLMRRALRGIVPNEILDRPRKAFLLRSPLAALRRQLPKIEVMLRDARLADLGLIEPEEIRRAARQIERGEAPSWWPALPRTALAELWLRSLPTNQ